MPAAGVVTSNLLAEYQFVGIGSGTTVSDTSGNGNTLTLGPSGSAVLTAIATSQVAPTWQSDGLLFDATTNTIATAPDDSIVSESTTDFSAELWVKPTPISLGVYFNFGWDDHILEDDSNTSKFWPSFLTEFYRTGGSVATKSVQVETSLGVGFTANAWYQVVVTREPSTGKLTTYVNGVHQHDNWGSASAWDTNGMALPSSSPDGLRAARTIGGDTFDGDGVSALFGEIRFYGSVLSDADVLQNYNARQAAITGGVVHTLSLTSALALLRGASLRGSATSFSAAGSARFTAAVSSFKPTFTVLLAATGRTFSGPIDSLLRHPISTLLFTGTSHFAATIARSMALDVEGVVGRHAGRTARIAKPALAAQFRGSSLFGLIARALFGGTHEPGSISVSVDSYPIAIDVHLDH